MKHIAILDLKQAVRPLNTNACELCANWGRFGGADISLDRLYGKSKPTPTVIYSIIDYLAVFSECF